MFGKLKKAEEAKDIVSCLADCLWAKRFGVLCPTKRKPRIEDIGYSVVDIVNKHREWKPNNRHPLSERINNFFDRPREKATSEVTFLPSSEIDPLTTLVRGNNTTSQLPPLATVVTDSVVPLVHILDVTETQADKLAQMLYFLLYMLVPVDERTLGPYNLSLTLRELVYWLWPKVRNGEQRYRRWHLDELRKLLHIIHNMRVVPRKDPDKQEHSLITVYQIPTTTTSLDAFIGLQLRCPPGSGQGARVLRSVMDRLTSDYYTFRTFVRLNYFWDGQRWKQGLEYISSEVPSASDSTKLIKNTDTNKVPALTDTDLIHMTNGHNISPDVLASRRRRYNYRERSKHALKMLVEAGDIHIEETEEGKRILPTWNDKLKL